MSNSVCRITKGNRPQYGEGSAFFRALRAEETIYSGTLATFGVKGAGAGIIVPVNAANFPTKLKNLWLVVTGSEQRVNSKIAHIEKSTPITAVRCDSLFEFQVYDRFAVAVQQGSAPKLCVCTAAGVSARNLDGVPEQIVLGQFVWGTPGEGDFNGTAGRAVIKDVSDIFDVLSKDIEVGATKDPSMATSLPYFEATV